MGSVPVIDLTPWFDGDDEARAAVAAAVDEALQDVGFLLVTGHGVPTALRDAVREQARAFFALPDDAKRQYVVGPASSRGWVPPGVEANGNSDPYSADAALKAPDLKESYAIGSSRPTGDVDIDRVWFPPNVWPEELPDFESVALEYRTRMNVLADELLRLFAAAIGVPDTEFFTRHTGNATHSLYVNWYPPLGAIGEPEQDQFRIGPHTDFGTVTILDRQQGRGGLQVWTETDGWEDAPWVEGALTINTGDLLARWSGDRWKSNRHRVLPPQAEAPDEDLVSLIFFYEADADTVVESLQPPYGRPNDHAPVVAGEFVQQRLDAVTVG